MRLAYSFVALFPVAVLAVVSASCFDEPKPTCQFACGPNNECPAGYGCGADDRCHLEDGEGNLLACETPLPVDAATNDGGATADASSGDGDSSTPDASAFDASAPDASAFDASAFDASAPDASAPDASAPDASAPDASAPDASAPDATVADAALPDATPTCSASLSPSADGSIGAPQELVIAEVNPGDYIEIYNNTGSAIDLGASSYQFCSPFNYASVASLAPGSSIAAGGRMMLPWPAAFADVDGGGEIILYATSSFGDSAQISDFICWGTNPHGSRLTQAASVNKWTGGCAPAITGGAIHRLVATTGTTLADYDTASAPSGETCAP